MILSLKWGRNILGGTTEHTVYLSKYKADKFKGFDFKWFKKVHVRLRITLFYRDLEIGYSIRYI